jgi:hypothetical protein
MPGKFHRTAPWPGSAACVVGLLAAVVAACLKATAIDTQVYTEVSCSLNAPVSIVVGSSLDDLSQRMAQGVVASTQSGCASVGNGYVGDVVMLPQQPNEQVAYAVMTRPDGQPSDQCGTAAQAAGCIVAKRNVTFLTHEQVDVRVDLRLSCLGVSCSSDQTCAQGQCVAPRVPPDCSAPCGDNTLMPVDAGGTTDARADSSAGADASLPAAVRTSAKNGNGMSSLTVSLGAVDANELLIVTVFADTKTPLMGVSDTAGNAFQKAVSYIGDAYVYYAEGAKAAPFGDSITATLSSGGGVWFDLYVSEFSGVRAASSLDAVAAQSGNCGLTTDDIQSGFKTTTNPTELVFAFAGASGPVTAGTGYSLLSPVDGNATEYRVVTADGSYQATGTCTQANADWQVLMATFKGQ